MSSRTSNQILPETKQMELTTTANYIQEDGMSIRQGNEWRNVVQCFDLLCNFLEPATPNLNSNKEVQCSCTDPFLWSVESDGESNTAGVTHGAHSQEFLSMTHLVLCPDVGGGGGRWGRGMQKINLSFTSEHKAIHRFQNNPLKRQQATKIQKQSWLPAFCKKTKAHKRSKIF